MGLDCSHDAFHGAYSAFNRFRQAVCYVIGGSYPPHDKTNRFLWTPEVEPDPDAWYWGHGYSHETHPGLGIFLNHSDCDGEISPEDCLKVAKDLEPLVARLSELGVGDGHIARGGGYGAVCQNLLMDVNELLKLESL